MTENQQIRAKALELAMGVFQIAINTNPAFFSDKKAHFELTAQEFVIGHSKAFEKYLKESE